MQGRFRKISIRRERSPRKLRLRRTLAAKEALKESLYSIRIAVYRDGDSCPTIEDISTGDVAGLLALASARAYALARGEGGQIGDAAIREIIENLLHANFCGATISILNHGQTIVVSDQGQGISNKDKAMLPGFTTASLWMRRYIRGVGSGFLVASECMERANGTLRVEDNLASGAVVILEAGHRAVAGHLSYAHGTFSPGSSRVELLERQKRVLLILAENQQLGPTAVAQVLGVSLATAHRDMSRLETLGFVQYVGKGKRSLTADGYEHVRSLFRR